jgi:hypothetical protein
MMGAMDEEQVQVMVLRLQEHRYSGACGSVNRCRRRSVVGQMLANSLKFMVEHRTGPCEDGALYRTFVAIANPVCLSFEETEEYGKENSDQLSAFSNQPRSSGMSEQAQAQSKGLRYQRRSSINQASPNAWPSY